MRKGLFSLLLDLDGVLVHLCEGLCVHVFSVVVRDALEQVDQRDHQQLGVLEGRAVCAVDGQVHTRAVQLVLFDAGKEGGGRGVGERRDRDAPCEEAR